MKNWKTTVLGVAGAAVAFLVADHDISTQLAGFLGSGITLLFGLVSKDHNVTGGSTQQ